MENNLKEDLMKEKKIKSLISKTFTCTNGGSMTFESYLGFLVDVK